MESLIDAGPSLNELRAQYLAAQLRGDRREALSLALRALDAGHPASALLEHVIEAAQREIGRLWEQNQISIADEHMATAISQMALAHLYDRTSRSLANGKQILVACVAGELHELPARLVADALDLAGFDVRYLGADVPTPSLLRMIALQRPDLLALSATMSFNLPSLREVVHEVRAAQPNLPIAVGGNACLFEKGTLASVAADITANNARQLIGAAHRFLGLSDAGRIA